MEAFAVLAALTLVMEEAKLEAQLARFPPPQVTNAWVEFSWNHEGAITEASKQCPKEMRLKYFLWLHDIEQRRKPWILLQQAQNRVNPIASRRYRFNSLQKEIGTAAFIQGQMPPSVPLSRFLEGSPPLRIVPAESQGNETGIVFIRFPRSGPPLEEGRPEFGVYIFVPAIDKPR
jgi:hypothetical protein